MFYLRFVVSQSRLVSYVFTCVLLGSIQTNSGAGSPEASHVKTSLPNKLIVSFPPFISGNTVKSFILNYAYEPRLYFSMISFQLLCFA